jgi:hypothetical protein
VGGIHLVTKQLDLMTEPCLDWPRLSDGKGR